MLEPKPGLSNQAAETRIRLALFLVGVFTQFQRAFGVPENTVRTIREFLGLKNDISLFRDESHPYNNDDFSLDILFRDPENAGG